MILKIVFSNHNQTHPKHTTVKDTGLYTWGRRRTDRWWVVTTPPRHVQNFLSRCSLKKTISLMHKSLYLVFRGNKNTEIVIDQNKISTSSLWFGFQKAWFMHKKERKHAMLQLVSCLFNFRHRWWRGWYVRSFGR